MNAPSNLPAGNQPPSGFEPWCTTLRGEQAWRHQTTGGAPALELWRTMRDLHPRTGLWPVLLGDDAMAIDQLTWRLEMLARSQPGIPSLDEVPGVAELFDRWMGSIPDDDYLTDVPKHLAKLEADASAIRDRLMTRPDEDAVRTVAGATCTVALVPARAGWEVPALLAWAGAERYDINGPEHLAILNFWEEAYGAELVAVGLERLECLVARPPVDARAAFELAVQQYAYCPALMDNLAPAIGALAATLFGRHWLFDWS